MENIKGVKRALGVVYDLPLDGAVVVEVLSKKGRPLLLYQNYTYAKYSNPTKFGWRWYCSRKKGCRAHIVTTTDHEVLAIAGDHNHERLAEDSVDKINRLL